MRAASSALRSYLAAVRAGTQPLYMADCFTFTLQSGAVLTYCDKDVPVKIGATVFLANSLRVDGLTFKCSVGLGVDTQQLTIEATPADLVGGVPVLVAMRNGLFDGCQITRDRAFFATWPPSAPAIGSVNLFSGRLATVDTLGRTTAQVTVNSLLTLLDISMPRNQYQPNCNHALFDAGCGLSKAAYATNGAVGAGSTAGTIAWTGARNTFTQGTITMTSGVNAGIGASVKTALPGTSLTLLVPFETPPAVGDTFTAYPGCDHTTGTGGCAKFNNLVHFGGFPYIPPPSATYATTTG